MAKSADLFDQIPDPSANTGAKDKAAEGRKAAANRNDPSQSYTAKDIEVLEGLEPVRRRPGMYIGGNDARALHHLAAEVIDNAMDEVVAGHATRISVSLAADNILTVQDNGRGIPVDPHPRFKDKSALEVILTTLHAGAKFGDKQYQTSGGMNGVGISVVNALSQSVSVSVARDKELWSQSYIRGIPTGKLTSDKTSANRRGTTVTFQPDPEIFGENAFFSPSRLYEMVRAKAYLQRGVEVRWQCDSATLGENSKIPESETFKFPNGLGDFLDFSIEGKTRIIPGLFSGAGDLPSTSTRGSSGDGKGAGRVEWAVAWPRANDGAVLSYCNTIPTPEGGTHEAGLRAALTKGLKSYGDLINNKRASVITGDDVMDATTALLSVFLPDPLFRGQTKEKLANPEATKAVEQAIRDHFETWLSASPDDATALLEWVINRAEERIRHRQEREVSRKSATRKLRLPGKLADCSQRGAAGAEIFIVEGDSAGGSAKQARNRATQAILPLRGKILNVTSAGAEKMRNNQEISNLIQALGCGTGAKYSEDQLRYEKVIIMTDADVDGAHIAALLMTFFYSEMPKLIDNGHLYLAVPPLYRLSQGGKTLYARDDLHKDELMASTFTGKGKVEVSRFKGLGEMPAAQLKETTMNPANRTLLQIFLPEDEVRETARKVDHLMGKKPELRFAFIQENARFATDLDI